MGVQTPEASWGNIIFAQTVEAQKRIGAEVVDIIQSLCK